MIKIRKTIICIATAALALASCQMDDTLYYNNMTMGNVVDGKFVTDQGNTFNVVEQVCSGTLGNQKRVMTLCDVLDETSSNEYDVRLTTFFPVLDKKPVALEEATDAEIAVQDPVYIEQMWFSGGYINMMIKTFLKTGSKEKHLINLVYSKDEEGKYIFNLRHNAYGEVWSEENKSQVAISGGSYVSFPIADIIKEDKAQIVLNWKWYLDTDMDYDFKTEKDYSFGYNWERKGFIQKF